LNTVKTLIAPLKSGWFITLIGVILLSILVWFGGPYLGIGTLHPLESVVARLVAILLIIVVWAAWLQIMQLRARSKTKHLSADMAGQAASPGTSDQDLRGSAERTQLQMRFQEAIDTLRKGRRGGGNLYTLPWYVVIGPPGSGKSTLLQNSGLHFPLSDRFGKDALRGIGGTRNCDWWFTDEAVFLDTAGRYTTQDSDQMADASAWVDFLHLLRRYRKRRPINGVIIALSMSDLLLLDDAERYAHIQAIRRRLDELSKHLHIGVPAYLVFTKCDLIAGFTEFFDDLTPDLRNQVWGFTFPVAKTMDGSAAKDFDEEFGLLMDRLNTRVLERLHAEHDQTRRAAILSFPQQLNALREVAKQFTEGVFSAHQYGTQPLLRGAYLTSGTQEGTPIDRMMGAVARTFGVGAAQVHAPGAQQRTFFISRLLQDVVFAESGFAGTNPAMERRKAMLQIASYAGVLAVAGLLLTGLTISYMRNTAYLQSVNAALKHFPAKSNIDRATTQKAYFERVLERLDALSAVQTAAQKYHNHVPWQMGFGLYQGHEVAGQTQAAYVRELNGLLLPGLASEFRMGITNNAADPQKLYYFLKGYLMLAEPRHMNANELMTLGDIEWQQLFPNVPVIQKALAKNLHVLVTAPGALHPLSPDATLVERARNTLRSANMTTLIYSSMKLKEKSAEYAPLRLSDELGLLGNVFQNKDGTPLSTEIPALYTQPVFEHEANEGIEAAVDQFTKDDWVFGAARINTVQQADLVDQVLGLYQQDYIHTWDTLISNLQLQPVSNLLDASALAAKLSGPSSPLKALLLVVRHNTSDMMRKPPTTAVAQKLKAVKQDAEHAADKSALEQALASGSGSAPVEKPGAAIAAHFKSIDELTQGSPGSEPIDQVFGVLKQLSQTLLTMSDSSVVPSGHPNPQLQLAQQQVAQLPSPVSTWLSMLTGDTQSLMASGAEGALQNKYQQAVGKNCAEVVNGRYPFSPESAVGVPLQNFAELFGTGGRFDKFYTRTLEKLINTNGVVWRWKSGPGAIHGHPGLLREMQMADQIRKMYFHRSSTPVVDFTLVNPVLSPGISKLVIDVDGQKYTYQPGGTTSSDTMRWPGPHPGQVSVAAYDDSGTLISRFDYQGDWAFFHVLQAAHLQRKSDLLFPAQFNFGGKTVTITVKASNLVNPFLNTVVQNFRCGG
jgi:type VI secretion system protein ImpL